jgi:hypothetical protein
VCDINPASGYFKLTKVLIAYYIREAIT